MYIAKTHCGRILPNDNRLSKSDNHIKCLILLFAHYSSRSNIREKGQVQVPLKMVFLEMKGHVLFFQHAKVIISQFKSTEVNKIFWFGRTSLLLFWEKKRRCNIFPSCRNWPICKKSKEMQISPKLLYFLECNEDVKYLLYFWKFQKSNNDICKKLYLLECKSTAGSPAPPSVGFRFAFLLTGTESDELRQER